MVFTGGARPGARSEAEAMAAWAMTTGIPGRVMRIEDQSRSTRENVRFALPLVENCGTVVFASDPMHAARARRYAIEQRPDLADRLAVGDDYRFLERWWWKVPTAAYELWISGRDRLRARRAPRP
jgi:uncharacterized SAM-binding protein YcdF (DUF218 family)